MPVRGGLRSRAHESVRKLKELPEARDVVLPELLAGSAGAPLEWTRSFHHFFFAVAKGAIDGGGLLVLEDVVVGRPSPLLREIELWGATVDADELIQMSSRDIGHELGIAQAVTATICTEGPLLVGALESAPSIDDLDLRRSITAALVITTSVLLARAAPYIRVSDGVVRAYRPSGGLAALAREPRGES